MKGTRILISRVYLPSAEAEMKALKRLLGVAWPWKQGDGDGTGATISNPPATVAGREVGKPKES